MALRNIILRLITRIENTTACYPHMRPSQHHRPPSTSEPPSIKPWSPNLLPHLRILGQQGTLSCSFSPSALLMRGKEKKKKRTEPLDGTTFPLRASYVCVPPRPMTSGLRFYHRWNTRQENIRESEMSTESPFNYPVSFPSPLLFLFFF